MGVTKRDTILEALSTVAGDVEDDSNSAKDAGNDDFTIDQKGNEPGEQVLETVYADKISGNEDDDGYEFRVPKYFQAILTLFVCFFLLFCTLAIISQVRRLCQKSTCTRKIPLGSVNKDKSKNGESGFQCVVTDDNGMVPLSHTKQKNADKSSPGGRHFDYYGAHARPASADEKQLSNITDTQDEEQDLLKLKRVRFVRRVSGPFGDEALDYIGETYKAKYKESPHPHQQPHKPGEAHTNVKNQSIRKHPH